MNTITVSDLKKLIGKINLIDLRSSLNFNNNHIEGAKNIEYNVLISDPSRFLNKTNKFYIYCQKGVKSYKACSYLEKLGYSVINVIGGYESWILEN